MSAAAASERRVKPWLLVAAATAMLAWGGNHFTPLLLMYRQVDGYSSVEVDLYCSLTYVGFLMPVALAALAASTSYVTLLIVVALLCLGSAVTAGWNLRSARRAAEPDPALA